VFYLVDRLKFFDHFIVFYFQSIFYGFLILSSELRFGAMYSGDPDAVICAAGRGNTCLQFATSLAQSV